MDISTRADRPTDHRLSYVRWFEDLGLDDIALVGGKTASLGELYRLLKATPVSTPDGFALTAEAYRDALTQAGGWAKLTDLFAGFDVNDVGSLASVGEAARAIVYEATGGEALRSQIGAAFRTLKARCGQGLRVAVRSSATAEDLPHASFAGQHDSFLHVGDEAALVEACRRCFASLFTDRAIVYRQNNGFDHFKVALSVAVMAMVDADRGASGVTFTLDTESGFREVVYLTAVYGLGENIVQGRVAPDEFYVHKPTLQQGYRAVLRRALGSKQTRLAHARNGELRAHPVRRADRERFCLSDAEVLDLAEVAMRIEDHYSTRAGSPTPMDIEWARDGRDGRLYILQARPETVASRRSPSTFETYRVKGGGQVLASGKAVGEKAASGRVRRIENAADLRAFRAGEVLVATSTSPDWLPAMKIAAAIVTDQGGRTCHAAIVARELGVPAVVGAHDATARLAEGVEVTVSCAQGETGVVYEGVLPIEVERLALETLPQPKTKIMVNLAQPDLAFRTALLPSAGVGLARLEFIIGEQIGVHPMAAAHPEQVADAAERKTIERLSGVDASPRDRFVRLLSEGVGVIAAAFYPRPVIVRLSDFKTNEYAKLLGGAAFEPAEENPMLGFRGAARYAHPRYADGFALECEALLRVRETMGLTNVKVMVPFCRRVDEARRVLDALADRGLRRGDGGLEIYVMCEIPNNVIQIDAFAELFDGFSIGSNDLTQLVLGVDRDSEIVAFDFDERDPGVLEMLRQAVLGARRNGRQVGICGEAPATYPEIAAFLAALRVHSISVNPSSVPKTLTVVAEAEAELADD
ncbi:MAG: phosphoenolpyruvate synthase [Phenylobacterium sp.]|uniref:phosphoenolpyruvate synthase n=1 Tax=Phenylobacterium sp. TaxID=1871053 RepID=UPI003919546B